MSARVVIAATADKQIDAHQEWWTTHRRDAPGMFADEFALAIVTLEVTPDLGTPHYDPRVEGVRRLQLRGTRHALYYLHELGVVTILAVTGPGRGSPPRLGR